MFPFVVSAVPLPRLIVSAACALGVLATLAPVAGAAYKGRNGELAYEGRASSSGLLLVTGPKGGKPRRLTAPGTPADPAFSPLGRRIAFTSRTEIWVMYADGSGVRQVTVGPEPSRDPTWSPDAARIAFTTGYKRERDLYRIGADGSGLKRLTTSRLDDEAPAWSSTNLLAFVRHRSSGDGDIAVMKSGGGRVRLLTGGDADDADPAWSPDGRRIVFTRLPKAAPPRKKAKKGKKAKRPPHVRELWVMRADGSKARRLATLPAGAGSPVFSPDGKRIAFTMGKYGRRALYVIRSGDGRGLRRLAAAGADARSLDWQPRGGDPVIAAAGDIACDPGQPRFASGLGTRDCHMLQTSDLMMKMDLSAVLPLGDLQYEDGALVKFQQSFDPTWGRLKSLMRPVVGNHEYGTPGAAGYFDYFNGPGVFDGPAGPRDKGYYSYDIGAWHVVTLNSECSDPKAGNPYLRDCDAGSPQEQWLRADLAQHRTACTLAVWHHPLFSSGIEARNDHVRPLFQALYENGVDLLLTGHDHGYERFAPMDAAGNRDGAAGVRQFVVGTGGKNHQQNRAAQPNSEVRNVTDFGVLELDLGAASYRWQFVAEGSRVLDAGANSCH